MTPSIATAVLDSIPDSVHALIPSGILSLADAALRAILVACIVGAGLRIMAARHVLAQKTAWGLVLAGALLMPVLAPWAGNVPWVPAGATWIVPTDTWSSNILSGATLRGQQAAAASPVASLASTDESAFTPAAPEPMDRSDAPLAATPQADRFPSPTISYSQTAGAESAARPAATTYYLPVTDLVWIIYGAVCLGLLLRLCFGLGGAIGLWQSAEPIEIDPLLSRGLHLRSSGKITSPVTVGSAVVLPADYDEWDLGKLRIVLAHERSHVRQGDFYLQALAGLYAALFWFSPLGWWLKRKLSELSETISDRAGLEQAESHASYARILLEFAALPRRVPVGVAMARTGGLSQRIERLLNENSFRQAFAGGRRRLLAAAVLVSVTVFSAAALIRVQAAQTLKQPVSAQGPIVLQSHPLITPPAAKPPASVELAQAPATPPAPATPAAPETAPPSAGPAPTVAPKAAPATPPPATPPDADDEDQSFTTQTQCNNRSASVTTSRSYGHSFVRNAYSYAYSSDGDSYALVTGKDQRTHFAGDWHTREIDKARSAAHGNDFLWFSREGKSYVVDDPRTIVYIQAMYKPMEELGRRQQELGDRQRALGEQQRELGRRQRETSIPTPDVSKEMADLNAAIAKLNAQKNSTITMHQLGEIQGKIGELEGKLGGLHGELGARQGELGREQGRVGAEQGRLGAEQGRLGAEQGRLARETDCKVHSIIDQTLKDGRAHPVQ